MNKTIFMFRTVTLRPHWFQYIINETGSLCLLVASIWIYKFCSFAYHELTTSKVEACPNNFSV